MTLCTAPTVIGIKCGLYTQGKIIKLNFELNAFILFLFFSWYLEFNLIDNFPRDPKSHQLNFLQLNILLQFDSASGVLNHIILIFFYAKHAERVILGKSKNVHNEANI